MAVVPSTSRGSASTSGAELAYAERTTNQTTTATTTGSATTLVTASAITADGVTAVIVEGFCAEVTNSAGGALNATWLFMDGSVRDLLCINYLQTGANNNTHYGRIRFVPAAGSRTFSLRITVPGGGTGTWAAAAEGGGVHAPCWIRVTSV